MVAELGEGKEDPESGGPEGNHGNRHGVKNKN
jgi:hypothetical protein